MERLVPPTCHGLSGTLCDSRGSLGLAPRLSWHILHCSTVSIGLPLPGQKRRSRALLLLFHALMSCVYVLSHISSETLRDYDFLTFEEYSFYLGYLIPAVPVFLDAGQAFPPFFRPSSLCGSFTVSCASCAVPSLISNSLLSLTGTVLMSMCTCSFLSEGSSLQCC